MELVVDANILFAALIGKGKTQELFFEHRLRLVAPLKLVSEFENNKELIARKGKVSSEELMQAFALLRERIEVYPSRNIPALLRSKAKRLAPHRKDSPYFALALFLGSALWSNEKAFKKQEEVRVYSTPELASMFLK